MQPYLKKTPTQFSCEFSKTFKDNLSHNFRTPLSVFCSCLIFADFVVSGAGNKKLLKTSSPGSIRKHF